ncbi:MAG: nuclear transport factor 2 family protein [Anaerolineales bacterium]|jgi:hypothetical protein
MKSDAEVRTQVHQALERFNELVATKNMQVLKEFAPGDEVLLVGSEAGEVASGRHALEAFFRHVFAREAAFAWQWDRIEVSHAGNLAWFFADGWVILSTAKKQRRAPYRISGVLERHGGRWLWRQYHGSEPVTGK